MRCWGNAVNSAAVDFKVIEKAFAVDIDGYCGGGDFLVGWSLAARTACFSIPFYFGGNVLDQIAGPGVGQVRRVP
jgi:hypothetical protein